MHGIYISLTEDLLRDAVSRSEYDFDTLNTIEGSEEAEVNDMICIMRHGKPELYVYILIHHAHHLLSFIIYCIRLNVF